MKKIILLLILINFFSAGHTQIIRGTIFDKTNKTNIGFASVYINGTNIGTNSDQNGHFELDLKKYRSHPLTISALGYYSVTLTEYSGDKPIIVYLTPKVFEMKQVVVEANSLAKERKKNLKIFRNEFLGTTRNAKKCVIVNENDIRFNYGKSEDTLKAFTAKPLIILNNGLGYKITYYLDKFEYFKKKKSFLYQGSAFFNEDFSTDLSQKESFERSRKYAYLGSRSHFFSSLWEDNTKSSGFIIRDSSSNILEYKDIVIEKNSLAKYFWSPGWLKIYYISKTPIGYVELLKKPVSFDSTGYFDGSGVRILGQMAKQRVGDLLPYSYKPDFVPPEKTQPNYSSEHASNKPTTASLSDSTFRADEKQYGFIKDGFDELNLNSPFTVDNNDFDSLVKKMNDNIVAVEKVYVETDRTDYVAGDTIWFSAFILGSLNIDSTSISRILYVDLINSDNKLEKHLKLLIRNGRCNGEFALQNDQKTGNYRLRAYTQYMRNYQSEYLFEKDIFVRESDYNNFIIVNSVVNGGVDGDSIGLFLRTVIPDDYFNENKQLEVFVRLSDTLSVKKMFRFKKNLNSSMAFFVPASLSCKLLDIRLTLSGEKVISERRISLNLKPGISLNFYPESGKIVAGIETVIAYKAIDNESNPAEFEADIVDDNNNKVIHISGNESGIGKFKFAAKANRVYKAQVTLSENRYAFSLPFTEPTGYIMNFNSDSGMININNNQNITKQKHYLLVSVRGAVYSSIEVLLDTATFRIPLPFETYPKGIVQITLFDSLFHPIAERLAFNKRPDQRMSIHVETDKKEYKKGEKVNMTINVTDSAGDPVESSLTMAVVDALKSDSLSSSAGIESSLFLASELKGEIDNKLLNFSDTTILGSRNIDLVMMTQGWRNFLWNSIHYRNKLAELFPIETGFSISGTVSNYQKGRSSADYKLNFIDLKTTDNSFVTIDETNRFKIDFPFFYNDHFLFIQNRNKKGRVDYLDLKIDTFPVPSISYRNNELPYISLRPGKFKTPIEKIAKTESKNESVGYTIDIPEVTIKRKYHPWDTEADITINLDTKDPTGEKYSSLFDMIYKEFGEKAFKAVGYGTYNRSFPPILIVNGAHLTSGSCPPCYDFDAYRWATIIPVNEISNVKFYEAGGEYSRFVTPPQPSGSDAIMNPEDEIPMEHNQTLSRMYSGPIFPSVVSFTTYPNSYRGNPKGTIVFQFQGIFQASEFYKPDYENNTNRMADNRTTIYWNPEIRTDSTGKATVSFYNSDLHGKALIRISGVSYFLNDVASASFNYLSK